MFKNEQKGFTLVEITVVIAIIILLSGIVLANYRVGEKEYALLRSAHKLVQDIRRVQAMAMGAVKHSSCPAGYKYGYGAYLTTAESGHYILFADCDNGEDYDLGEGVEDIKFETKIKITTLSGNPLTITFTPPDPTIKINPTATSATITLTYDGKTKTVKINTAGLIEIK